MKYTISVNADEYMYGIYDTKAEATIEMIKLVEQKEPQLYAQYQKSYQEYGNEDESFEDFMSDILMEMSEYTVKELHGVW